MKIKLTQLAAQLKHGLASIYLVSGDEPLLIEETIAYLKKCAKKQGFSEQKTLVANATFKWQLLIDEGQTLSLFSEQKLVEVQLASGKPGKAGASVLTEFAKKPPADTLLILRLPKLSGAQQKSKWYTHLEQNGVAITIWPITQDEFPSWLQRRLQRVGLSSDAAGIDCLAQLCEGNLLAAKQNIDKLALLYPDSAITEAQIASALSDTSHYDVYTLLDEILQTRLLRANKILTRIRAQGVEAMQLFWLLQKELRTLTALAQAQSQRTPLNDLWRRYGVWPKRQSLLQKHLRQFSLNDYYRLLSLAAHCEQILKGAKAGTPWLALEDLVLRMCSPTLMEAA
jgi:DNA polymerase-3 subunit delta